MQRLVLLLCGPPPDKDAADYDVAKWLYARRFMLRVYGPLFVAGIALSISQAIHHPVLIVGAVGFAAIWATGLIQVNLKLRRVRAAKRDPFAR